MNFNLSCCKDFSAEYVVRDTEDGIRVVHISADATDGARTLDLKFSWQVPDVRVNLVWTPLGYTSRNIGANWSGYSESYAMRGAPVISDLDYSDRNRQTIACSDAENSVKMHTGVVEETGMLDCVVKIAVAAPVAHYECDVRIDTRDIPFYRAVADVRRWWETYPGMKPMPVPDAAREPLYSAWYSYHQRIDVDAIVDECRYFSKLGAEVLIVDDGWQTSDNSRGYNYCGDWQPTPDKVPSMRAFADAVHSTGMKFMIWYSVPFIGSGSEVYKKFGTKTLNRCGSSETYVLDPRYPEVREHLIELYRRAVTDWDLDGLKLDFVDSFRQNNNFCEGMDCRSVHEAVDRLMKGVSAALREIKPDILIEFRQSYIGPLMRTYGNMFRSGDCPADSFTNRQHILALRMTSGGTAVHSDMVMWHPDESAEEAAYQLTAVLFSVPQISVRHSALTPRQAEMVADYLAFWKKYRNVLLDGEMNYYGCGANFPFVSSRLGDTLVGAVYSGGVAHVGSMAEETVIVNASPDRRVMIDAAFSGEYCYTVYDCTGRETASGRTSPGVTGRIDGVPENGRIVLTKYRY